MVRAVGGCAGEIAAWVCVVACGAGGAIALERILWCTVRAVGATPAIAAVAGAGAKMAADGASSPAAVLRDIAVPEARGESRRIVAAIARVAVA